MKLAVRADHVSKEYRIGTRRATYSTFRHMLSEKVGAQFRRLRANSHAEEKAATVWACAISASTFSKAKSSAS